MVSRGILVLIGVPLLLGIAGLGLLIWGCVDYSNSRQSSSEPISVDLANLEGGARPDNFHLRIGPHAACYFATVYEYEYVKKHRLSRPKDATPESKVVSSFYPIVSTSNPDVKKKLDDLTKKYG